MFDEIYFVGLIFFFFFYVIAENRKRYKYNIILIPSKKFFLTIDVWIHCVCVISYDLKIILIESFTFGNCQLVINFDN